MYRHLFLHEGGHGHEPCGGHKAGAITPEQTLALLGYMLDHNRSHAEELHDIIHALEDQGKGDAAGVLEEAMDMFRAANAKLESALILARED